MNFYYIVFERTTILSDIYTLLWDSVGSASNNCWYQNSTACKPGPNYLWVYNAGP